MAQIAPSILSADFARLGEDVAEVCGLGIDYLHIDVMDGAFVPNISFGAGVMKSLNKYTTVPYDVHLMIEDPDRYLKDFVTEHTAFLTVHQEACRHLHRTLMHIHELGVKAGVSVNPATPVSLLEEILPEVDLVLIMSVNPGFGGQKFIERTLHKLEQLRELRERHGYHYLIEIDGGVKESNAARIREAGADLLVAGSAVFGAANRAEAVQAIRG